MTITAVYKDGKEQAKCVCDECKDHGLKSNEVFVTCMHGDRKAKPEFQNNKTIIQKLHKLGWKIFQKGVVCDVCMAKRKEKKVSKTNVTKIEPNRQPSREQKRDIVLMLQDVYSVDKQCYTKSETDKTVANILENGIMWGWVKEIREDMFGPDGNEDDQLSVGEAHLWIDRTDKLAADLETKIKSFEKQMADMNRTLTGIQSCRKEVKGFLDTIQKLAK